MIALLSKLSENEDCKYKIARAAMKILEDLSIANPDVKTLDKPAIYALSKIMDDKLTYEITGK